jgi:hypothetical protein
MSSTAASTSEGEATSSAAKRSETPSGASPIVVQQEGDAMPGLPDTIVSSIGTQLAEIRADPHAPVIVHRIAPQVVAEPAPVLDHRVRPAPETSSTVGWKSVVTPPSTSLALGESPTRPCR